MCDTMVALGDWTREGDTLFAKNSDREPDEAQNLEVVAGGTHAAGEEVQCTYLKVPQAAVTYQVLLSRPFWMFGAEMGANEHGVVIGNEAVFTRVKPAATGLTGMDLLRLALERSRSAGEARDTIISLLETHGQGGKCGYRHHLSYMNGFLMADASEAYVLETVDRDWAWKQVRDYWSISNVISITDDYDACSPGLVRRAVDKGWCGSESEFNFRECYSDRIFTWGAQGRPRECRSRAFLRENKNIVTTADLFRFLRDHGEDPDWSPGWQTAGTVCMHANNPLTRPSQSTGSLVARIGRERKSYYATGASNPCFSPFFPVFTGADLPSGYRPGGDKYDEESYWWWSEAKNRRMALRFERAMCKGPRAFGKFERRMVEAVESGGLDQAGMDRWFEEAKDLKRRWSDGVSEFPVAGGNLWLWWYLGGFNKRNKVPV